MKFKSLTIFLIISSFFLTCILSIWKIMATLQGLSFTNLYITSVFLIGILLSLAFVLIGNKINHLIKIFSLSFLFSMAGLLNLLFYIFAIGFVISLLLEQYLKVRPLSVDASINERNDYIVQTNRKYCWRQAWVTNVYWFLCNVGLYVISRNMQTPSDTFWNGL